MPPSARKDPPLEGKIYTSSEQKTSFSPCHGVAHEWVGVAWKKNSIGSWLYLLPSTRPLHQRILKAPPTRSRDGFCAHGSMIGPTRSKCAHCVIHRMTDLYLKQWSIFLDQIPQHLVSFFDPFRCSDDSRSEPCPAPHYRLCYNSGRYVDAVCPPVRIVLFYFSYTIIQMHFIKSAQKRSKIEMVQFRV